MTISKLRSTFAAVTVLAAAVLSAFVVSDARANSAGCDAMNAGGFNGSVTGGSTQFSNNFYDNDQLTITITWSNNGWGFGPLHNNSPSGNETVTLTARDGITNAGGAVFLDLGGIQGGGTVTSSNGSCQPAPFPTVTSVSPIQGTSNTTVVVTGTFFSGTGNDVVSFGPNNHSGGGIGCCVDAFSGTTSLTMRAPAGSGTVDVTVAPFLGPGTSAVNAHDQFTYGTAPPVPTVGMLTPNIGAQSGGTGVTITGTNFSGETAVQFGSTSATFTINSPTSITVTAPPCTGTVDVTVTTAGGTSATSPADEFTCSIASTHDFNGDHKSDILFRSTGSPSSTVAMWLMNGSSVLGTGTIQTLANTYSIIGQRDFNGDGDADLLLRDTSGNVYQWFLNGPTISSAANLGNVPNTWSVVGTADMNGDGKGDLLWQDTAGDVAVWFMNGSQVSSTAGLGTVAPSSNWSIVATTIGAILWKNTSSNPYAYALWLVNGSSVQPTGLGNVPSNWVVQGAGDFNGDGFPDILWRDSTSGAVAIWLLNGSGQVQSTGTVGTVSTSTTWQVAETGDFNGDGFSDILWIDGNGNLAIWFMNGTTVASTAGLGNVGTSWTVQSANTE